MARPTKYTPETTSKVIEAIKMGATYELAAGYAGISYELFRQWMRDKVEFLEAIKKAQGTGAMVWLAKIEKAASDGNWQAAAWKLERLYPEQYGRNVVVNEHKGEQQIRVIMDAAWRGEPQVIEEVVPQIATASDTETVVAPSVKLTFEGDGQ